MRPLELTPGHRQANTDSARYMVVSIRDASVNRIVRTLYAGSALWDLSERVHTRRNRAHDPWALFPVCQLHHVLSTHHLREDDDHPIHHRVHVLNVFRGGRLRLCGLRRSLLRTAGQRPNTRNECGREAGDQTRRNLCRLSES